MKRCPTCNRTYADETIAFCLADGALLSAPYDTKAGQHSPDSSRTDAPTEIIPTAPDRAALFPTQKARESEPLFSTIASHDSPNMRGLENLQTSINTERANHLRWIIGGISLLLIVGLAFVIGYNLSSYKKESATVNNNSTDLNRNASSAPGTSDTKPVDYGKIYSAAEVDQRVRLLTKPAPQYTEEARKNQVSGTVVLRVVLTANDTVTSIEAVHGLPYGLTEKAIEAAQQIQFVPAMKDGKAVSQSLQIEYNFSLY